MTVLTLQVRKLADAAHAAGLKQLSGALHDAARAQESRERSEVAEERPPRPVRPERRLKLVR